MTTTEQPATSVQRPNQTDESVLRAAATAIAGRIQKWLQQAGDDTTIDEIVSLILPCIKYERDGYALAKRLDGIFEPDEQLVEILGMLSSELDMALKTASRKWVIVSGICGPVVESIVTWATHTQYGEGIVTCNHDDGRSVVCFPSEGHVMDGAGSYGYVVAWECLRPVSAE